MNLSTGGIITTNHSGQAGRLVVWNSLRENIFKKECSDPGCIELETLESQVQEQQCYLGAHRKCYLRLDSSPEQEYPQETSRTSKYG